MVIGIVAEGPTDIIVLEALLDSLIPGNHRFIELQPLNPPERINGWKGVRDWCYNRDIEEFMSEANGDPIDLLVIQIDADIAEENDLQDGIETPVQNVSRPCPPISVTARQLEQVVLGWMKRDRLPDNVILAIPSQDMENWTFAALFPEDDLCGKLDYECIRKGNNRPVYKLTTKAYGKHLKSRGSEIKKNKRAYQKLAPKIVENWKQVRDICSQAEKFNTDIRSFIPQ